ncbi:hypothetical protein DM02DRAFT_724902 [Periconia macrospinosa]|uniref:F-box domain-containing protein n=1 Tax=Periconia macrospinosa TaxID=97972 RepID=A0A2V1E6U0_9PLEO|nr:hypothetical protein DM02DRAFT_724902 [Periconia macrospinosa]
MHRALLLPEIVSSILRTNGHDTKNLLFASLLTNQLFFNEAVRILWEACGARYEMCGVRHGEYWPTPKIVHLANIAMENVHRAQFYANFIRMLSFEYESDWSSEAKHHAQLAELTFPQLKEVAFYEADERAAIYNTGTNLLHYVQPTLTTFDVWTSSNISRDLLEALGRQCSSRLEYLKLRVARGDHSIEPSKLNWFIRKMRMLQVLDIPSLDWTFDTFREISRLPRLELLNSPPIQEAWLSKLNYDIDPFTSLKSIQTTLADNAVENLHRVCPRLQHLHLTAQATNHHLLLSASKLTQLQSLDIDAPSDDRVKWSITGSDLVHFSHKINSLQELSIAQDALLQRLPTAIGLNDSTFDAVARNSPSLKVLEFHYGGSDSSSTTSLTISSLYSLSKYCLNLERLEISCSIDWHALARGSELEPIFFPELWALTIKCHQGSVPLHHSPAFAHEDYYDVTDMEPDDVDEQLDLIKKKWAKLSKKIASFGPKLTSFTIEDGMGEEEELEREVWRIIAY